MGISAVIGDDMTGCMDAGIQLVKKGYRVSVAVNNDDIKFLAEESDVIIADTESRNTTPEKAIKKVHDYAKSIDDAGYKMIYKKVDSTLRGNIGSELEALLMDHIVDLIVFAPALPYNGRTTRNGVHYVNSLVLTDSDIAKDPFSPIQSSYIPDIINCSTEIKTTVINLDEVRQDAGGLAAKIDDCYCKGFRIVVVDAESEEDLGNIAVAVKNCNVNALACGSAGLFGYMMEKKIKELACTNATQNHNRGPVLVISGSPAEATKLQMKNLCKSGIKVVKFDAMRYSQKNSDWREEIDKIKKEVIKVLSCGYDIAIDGAGEGKVQIYERYKNHPDMLNDMSKIIQDTLFEIFEYVSANVKLGGAVVVGGDTVYNICNKLKVKGLKINGEVEPLIPCGISIGGQIDGMHLVTKAGGFGSQDVLLRSIKYLKREVYYEK